MHRLLVFILIVSITLHSSSSPSLCSPTQDTPTHHMNQYCCEKSSIISSGLCKRPEYYFIILGNSQQISPCPNDSITIDWNYSKVINETFEWFACNFNGSSSLQYYQVGGCISPRNKQLFKIRSGEIFSFINCIKDGNISISSEFITTSPDKIYDYISTSILPYCKDYQAIIYRFWVHNGDMVKCLNNNNNNNDNNSRLASASLLCQCPFNYSVVLGDGICNSTLVSQLILPVKHRHSNQNHQNNNNLNTKEEDDDLKKNKAIFSIFISLLGISLISAITIFIIKRKRILSNQYRSI